MDGRREWVFCCTSVLQWWVPSPGHCETRHSTVRSSWCVWTTRTQVLNVDTAQEWSWVLPTKTYWLKEVYSKQQEVWAWQEQTWPSIEYCHNIMSVMMLISQSSAFSRSGAKLDDFADFTTFGIATSLLLRTPDLVDNILCMFYVLSVFVRLCFFSSGMVSVPQLSKFILCIFAWSFLRMYFTLFLPQGFHLCTVGCPASTPQPSWPVPPCSQGAIWPCCGS